MAKNRLNTKQIEFCKQIANGKGNAEAYQIAFKSDKLNVCAVNANRLLKKPEIQHQIKQFRDETASLVAKANEKAAEKLAEGDIADKVERMIYLTKIMRGEVKVRNDKYFYDSKAGVVVSEEVEELPDHQARIKAISELNKMDGSYSPTKADITTGGDKLTDNPAAIIKFDGQSIEILK